MAAVIAFYSPASTDSSGHGILHCLNEGDEKFNFSEVNGKDEVVEFLSAKFCPSGGTVLDLSGSLGM